MITIAASSTTLPDGSTVQSPSTPIPTDAIAVICDGTNYTVYEPGDTLPVQPE